MNNEPESKPGILSVFTSTQYSWRFLTTEAAFFTLLSAYFTSTLNHDYQLMHQLHLNLTNLSAGEQSTYFGAYAYLLAMYLITGTIYLTMLNKSLESPSSPNHSNQDS